MASVYRTLLVALAVLVGPGLGHAQPKKKAARGETAREAVEARIKRRGASRRLVPAPRPGIIATLGPSTTRTKAVAKMIRSGISMARINLSHSNVRDVRSAMKILRAAERAAGRKVGVLFDLPGGKVRLGLMGSAAVELQEGKRFELVTGRTRTTRNSASTNYKNLDRHAQVGDKILIDDGRIVLKVVGKSKGKVTTRVEKGGALRSRVGLAIENRELPFPSMTAQDRRKLVIAVKNGATHIGVSMVQSAENVRAVRRALDRMDAKHVKIVAKIESKLALENLEAITDHSDVIMIARGDLSTAVGAKNLQRVQADIARRVRTRGKEFIAATGFMSNMIDGSRPSSANRADVRRALTQRPGWFMLNETAIGKHPVETVKALQTIIREGR